MSRSRRIAVGLCVAAGVLLGAGSAGAANYRIHNLESWLLVDIQWGSTAAYAPAHLWTDNGTQAQRFEKVFWRHLGFHLRAGHSGLCLGADPRQPYQSGVRVVQVPCNSNDWTQLWVDDSEWFGKPERLQNYGGKGLCLDVDNGAHAAHQPGMAVQLWSCVPTGDWYEMNQRFGVLWY